MQAHEATAVSICKKPDCPNEAPARGRYAGYCDEHRDLKPAPSAPKPGPGGKQPLAQRLRELTKLAEAADKAKARATVATQKALKVKAEADELEKQLREAMAAV